MTFRKTMFCVVIMLAGCAPTIPHGLGRVYSEKVYETLHTGEATRTDVLMTLGEPRYRLEEDRFFLYEWDVVYAWGYIPYGLPFPIYWPHYLCLEFTSDSFLIRREHIIGDMYGKPEKAIQKCTLKNQPEKTP